MYFLIVTYPGSREQILMHGNKKAIGALEDNRELLLYMGYRLLNENVISSYQLVKTVGSEVNEYNMAE